jgi:hypothetical protein
MFNGRYSWQLLRIFLLSLLVLPLVGCPSIPQDPCAAPARSQDTQAIRDAVYQAASNIITFDDDAPERRIFVTLAIHDDGTVARASIAPQRSLAPAQEKRIIARLMKTTFKSTGCKTPRAPMQYRVPVRIIPAE